MQIGCTAVSEVRNTRTNVDQGVMKYRGIRRLAVGWQLMVLEITLHQVQGAIHGTKRNQQGEGEYVRLSVYTPSPLSLFRMSSNHFLLRVYVLPSGCRIRI